MPTKIQLEQENKKLKNELTECRNELARHKHADNQELFEMLNELHNQGVQIVIKPDAGNGEYCDTEVTITQNEKVIYSIDEIGEIDTTQEDKTLWIK